MYLRNFIRILDDIFKQQIQKKNPLNMEFTKRQSNIKTDF